MHRFIALIRFTDQGAKGIAESTQRAKQFDAIAEKVGVEIEGQYWTFGSYDGVLIIRSASEQAALRCLAKLVSEGNVKTETLTAFTEEGFKNILTA